VQFSQQPSCILVLAKEEQHLQLLLLIWFFGHLSNILSKSRQLLHFPVDSLKVKGGT